MGLTEGEETFPDDNRGCMTQGGMADEIGVTRNGKTFLARHRNSRRVQDSTWARVAKRSTSNVCDHSPENIPKVQKCLSKVLAEDDEGEGSSKQTVRRALGELETRAAYSP